MDSTFLFISHNAFRLPPMKFKLMCRALVTLMFGVSALSASAALVHVGQGDTVDFYFEEGFWTGVNASVSGDRITFAAQPVLKTDSLDGGIGYDERESGADQAALVVVARNGYSFAGAPLSLVVGLTGGYGLPPVGGDVSALSGASVYAGLFENGVFSSSQYLGDAAVDAIANSDGMTVQSDAFDTVAYHLLGVPSAGPALGFFNVFFNVLALQDGAGESFAQIDSLSYSVSAVPEPGSLALLVTALGLSGWVGRRLKTSARSSAALA